eukprot:g78217.t1
MLPGLLAADCSRLSNKKHDIPSDLSRSSSIYLSSLSRPHCCHLRRSLGWPVLMFVVMVVMFMGMVVPVLISLALFIHFLLAHTVCHIVLLQRFQWKCLPLPPLGASSGRVDLFHLKASALPVASSGHAYLFHL